MTTVNLNDTFAATLTETGAIWWNAAFDNIPAQYRSPPAKAGDVIKIQLWVLMQVFGTMIFMGMAELPFQGNVIERME